MHVVLVKSLLWLFGQPQVTINTWTMTGKFRSVVGRGMTVPTSKSLVINPFEP
jgi:hypothetical protein